MSVVCCLRLQERFAERHRLAVDGIQGANRHRSLVKAGDPDALAVMGFRLPKELAAMLSAFRSGFEPRLNGATQCPNLALPVSRCLDTVVMEVANDGIAVLLKPPVPAGLDPL